MLTVHITKSDIYGVYTYNLLVLRGQGLRSRSYQRSGEGSRSNLKKRGGGVFEKADVVKRPTKLLIKFLYITLNKRETKTHEYTVFQMTLTF